MSAAEIVATLFFGEMRYDPKNPQHKGADRFVLSKGHAAPILYAAWAAAGLGVFLILVRVLSVAWALLTLYDFRLTRIREDLRSDYGLFTRVTATVPIRRVQTIHVSEGPLHRWLGRAAVRAETAEPYTSTT